MMKIIDYVNLLLLNEKFIVFFFFLFIFDGHVFQIFVIFFYCCFHLFLKFSFFIKFCLHDRIFLYAIRILEDLDLRYAC